MDILDMPQLADFDTMKRKDIVKIIGECYTSPNDATAMRLEIALKKGRKVDSLKRWLRKVDQYAKWDKTEYGGTKIGDKFGFVKSRYSRGGYHFSQHYGEVFAFGDNSAVVCDHGELTRFNLTDSNA